MQHAEKLIESALAYVDAVEERAKAQNESALKRLQIRAFRLFSELELAVAEYRNHRNVTLETLAWNSPETRPDADTTVLLHVFNPDNADDTVWPGFTDGEQWIWADGSPVVGTVLEWAHMPAGRGNKHG
jgi:hypothetical protein